MPEDQTSRNALFLVLILATIVCWWHWVPLLRLAYSNEQYSHVLLVLPVSVSFALLESRAKGVKPGLSSFPGLTMVLVALVLWLVAQSQMEVASETALAVGIAGLVVSWIGLVTLFFGVPAARQLLFPLLFLFLLVPTPRVLVDRCIVALQVASSEGTYMLFRWAGVPVLKSGFVLSLPALDIEVAKQCGGIRSGLMLLISVLVLGHSYLRSNWGKVLFVLAAIPMAVAKNAVRIFTRSMLGMHVNPGFLDGRLHRNGGVVFFVVALAGMVALLRGLQKAEAWTGGASVVQLCAQHLSSLKSWAT